VKGGLYVVLISIGISEEGFPSDFKKLILEGFCPSLTRKTKENKKKAIYTCISENQ